MDEKEVKEELGEGKLYGGLVVPAGFTSSITALTGATTTGPRARPTLTVLTNQSAGSMGSGLARTATTQGVLRWFDRKGLHRIPVETAPEEGAVPA
ncbi:hypothetical protein ACIP39_04450 [Streptomyces tibetensis]|uniref:hypothetical protein n=1 Tax=Streptomyces tibetensis TaxID=2382123 RepID=UPI0037F97F2E